MTNDADSFCAGHVDLVNQIDQWMESGDSASIIAAVDKEPRLLACANYLTGQYQILPAAANLGQLDLVRALVERGIDPEQKNQHTNTPLTEAASQGHVDVVEWLLSRGAAIDGAPDAIYTPLMSAISLGQPAVATLLIERGADVNRLHARLHQTPLDLAMVWGQEAIAALLRAKGAVAAQAPVDWSKAYLGSIIGYVDREHGRVLPIEMTSVIGQAQVSQRIALVNKGKNKLLFTVGLCALHKPMLELCAVMPAFWNMHDQSPRNQFASSVLRVAANAVAQGAQFREGDTISRDDPAYADLAWPDELCALFITDNNWGKEREPQPDEDNELAMHFFTLLPVKATRTGCPKQSLEKSRSAKWAKLEMPA